MIAAFYILAKSLLEKVGILFVFLGYTLNVTTKKESVSAF